MAEATETVSDLSELFEKAANHMKFLVGKLETAQLLDLYAHYKQATEGPCHVPKPRWYARQANQKWEAWFALGEMDRTAAMSHYVQTMLEIDPGWDQGGEEGSSGVGSWVAVSCLTNTDEFLDEAEKTIFDWVKEGNMQKVNEFASCHSGVKLVNKHDSEGMGLIHWAADRGNVNILQCLVRDLDANVNLQDGEGQTALHYAASCGHTEVVRFLLDQGADSGIEDLEGLRPVDVASGSDTVETFKCN